MFGSTLKALRLEKSYTQLDLAKQLNVTPKTISFYELDQRCPPNETLVQIANIFSVSTDYLLGREKKSSTNDSLISSLLASGVLEPIKTKKVPMLGSASCCDPIIMSEERDFFVNVSSSFNIDFALKAQGDSMIGARIYDGDIVFVKKMPMVADGKIAVVAIEDEVVLKRFYYDQSQNTVILVSENPAYLPKTFTGKAIDQIRILGQAVAFQSTL